MTTSPLCPGNCPTCFYCDAALAYRHEHDHYPLPLRAGGTETVAVCLNCHDLKDRTTFNNWRADVLEEAMVQAGPLGRILLAKLAALMCDYEAARDVA